MFCTDLKLQAQISNPFSGNLGSIVNFQSQLLETLMCVCVCVCSLRRIPALGVVKNWKNSFRQTEVFHLQAEIPEYMSAEEELKSPREANQYNCLTYCNSLLLDYPLCDRAQGPQPELILLGAAHEPESLSWAVHNLMLVRKITQPQTLLRHFPQP